jgi:hypothetical protein
MMEKGRESLVSRYYGVFTFSVRNMQEITCFVTDNLLGTDVMNVTRVYDLKGSSIDRLVKHSGGPSGLKVLKDMNYINLENGLQGVDRTLKEKLFSALESDS